MSDDKEKKEPISPEEEKGEENREEIPVEGLDISHKGPADSGDITDSIPDELPVIFIRDLTVFPYMALPLHVGREKSKKSVDKALHGNRMVLLLTQKDAKVEEPVEKDIYRVGTVVLILRMLKLSSGDVRLFVQGILRARVKELDLEGANPLAKIELIRDVEPSEETLELQALKKNLKQTFEKFIELGKQLPPELIYYIQEIEEAGRLADNILAYLTLTVSEAQNTLELEEPVARLQRVYELLLKEVQLLQVQKEISTKAKEEIDSLQKEYYLRQQMKAIQEQLGESGEMDEEIKAYREKLSGLVLPEEALQEVERQLSRLTKMSPESSESNLIRTYLDTVLSLPWSTSSKDNINIKKAKKILDEDHYDLEKVKERILEYLAVRKLTQGSKGPILCFVGPPGVGKTSLGRSIARAMGRNFVRSSLGGVHDEAEIRGHRRTYVGALPGRILQSLRQAGSNNPVFMLDEVDKIGSDYRGDPSSALLEVLDPEQNHSFRDNYLGVPFDLSKVLFITTANQLDTIQPAFLDRMEVIQLPGYGEDEKLHIAHNYLIPRQITENGLKKKDITFTDAALQRIIIEYTREAGVRNLEREIGAVCRKVAKEIASGSKKRYTIRAGGLEKYLSRPMIFRDQLLKENAVGVATGMAWTPTGGDILFIEATVMAGKDNLVLTGSLGEVMKESAIAALSFIKAHSADYGLAADFFKEKTVHIHVPEGAIPKDGPSAGVTMLSSMLSAFTGKPIRKEVAMTGEITLQGRVLPVGGIKSKVLAAQRAGIEEIVLPAFNKKDLDDIPKNIRRHLRFVFVEEASQVLEAALIDPSLPPKPREPKEALPPKRRGRPPKAQSQVASPVEGVTTTPLEKAEVKVQEGLPKRKAKPSQAKGTKPPSEETPSKGSKKKTSGKGAKKRPKATAKASGKTRKVSGEESDPSKKENP